MPGVRIHHPNLRNVTVALEHSRSYTTPLWCIHCPSETDPNEKGRWHTKKTYHIKVDGVGDAVVSETIHDRLKEINFAGFKVLGVEQDPEPIVLGLGGEIQAYDVVYQPTIATQPEGGGNG